MGRVVLVTDIETPLGLELAKKYAASGSSLIAASGSANNIESFAGLSDEKYFQVKWSRKSPISARNVVLSGLNHFKHIDEAVILQILVNHPAGAKRNNFGDLKFADIDSLIDTQVKGNLFLIKEIIHYMANLREETKLQGQTDLKENNKKDLLTIVQYCESSIAELDPIEKFVINGFETFFESLASSNKNININGFLSDAVAVTEYANFIFKTISEKSNKLKGRIFRFSNRQGIFVKKH